MTEYCDLDPHVRLSEAAEYTGIGIKVIQKYMSVERLIQPCEPPEKKGGWYLFGRKDFTRLLIIKKLVESGMLIPDAGKFLGWLDDSRVRLLRHTRRLQDLQEHTDNPNQYEINFKTEFGGISKWHGGDPNGPPPEPPWRVLNYDPFPTQISKLEFYNDESGYPRPPVEASGWLQYWKSVRQLVVVDQYRLMEEYPKYPVLHLLLPVRSLESGSKAANYTRRWGYRILGEITFEIMRHEASFAISGFRILDLAQIKAEVAERILNPPEAIKQRYRGSS